jgi:thiopurine S-methyltransferase
MAYLTSFSREVVGVEGVRLALEEFAQEHPELEVVGPTSDETTTDGFERYRGQGVTLLKGDYFNLDSTKTEGKFGLIYDRASMVAIEPNLREAYVDILGDLLGPGGKVLLVVLERKGTEEAMKLGPPYSIPDSTVREIFGNRDWVESIQLLEQSDQLQRKPEDKERYPDLDHLFENVYVVLKKE